MFYTWWLMKNFILYKILQELVFSFFNFMKNWCILKI